MNPDVHVQDGSPHEKALPPNPGTLDLGRSFFPVTTDPAVERSQRTRFPWSSIRPISWMEVLRKPCAVVLGEAGSGKTTELRRQAAELSGGAGYAFFLPIEAVAHRGVARALDLSPARALREWQGSAREAWFFLDSVDESKLKGRSLADALISFAHELEANLGRARVIISSRGSDWRSSDEDDVARLRPHLAPPDTAEETHAPILELAPLNDQQVIALGRHYGLTDESQFLEEVRNANAWTFLERPLDVQWLVSYWNSHKRLGTLRELLSHHIDERLKERPNRPSMLTVERARAGVRKLALVAQLAAATTFRLPGESLDLHAGDGFDPSSVLTDWTTAELDDLLRRGLFDDATYGRVRIHHRNAQEFLAAEELLRMMESGLPRSDLDVLLFRERHGKTYVPSNLHAVVAWCSLWDRHVRRGAIEVIPEHLLDLGDPSGLPTDDRKAALLAYAEAYGRHDRVFHYFDASGLKRFACPEIVGTMRELLTDGCIADHLRHLLLEIVEHGKIAALGDVALELALAAATPTYVRRAAIDATVAAGAAEQRRRLRELCGRLAGRHRPTAARCIDALFPDDLSIEHLAEWLEHVEPLREHAATELESLLRSEIVRRCGSEQRRYLIDWAVDHLLGSSTSDAADEEERQVPADRLWLGDLLGVLLKDLADNSTFTGASLERALEAVAVCQHQDRHSSNHKLGDTLRESSILRREIFWRAARKIHDATRRYPRAHWNLGMRTWLSLNSSDTSWLAEDVLQRTDVRERLLAFDTMLRLTPRASDSDQDEAFWKLMTERATASDERHGTNALQNRLARIRAWLPPLDEEGRWRLQSRAIDLRKEKARQQSRANLRAVLEKIRTGEAWQALAHLHDIAPVDESRSKYETVSCDAIAKRYDAEIAAAAREGFKQFWRTNEPVSIETCDPNGVPYSSMLGLTGIGFEVEDGLDVATLPDELLRKAFTLSLWEMNGLPSWLNRCAERRPDLMREVFAPALRADYEFNAPEGSAWNPRVLGKFTHAAPAIRRACAPVFVELLRGGHSPHATALRWTLESLDSADAPDPLDLELIRRRARSPGEQHFSIWWVRWLSREAEGAVAHLEAVLNGISSSDSFIEGLCEQIWIAFDERGRTGVVSLRSSVVALERLFMLIRLHVRPEEDVHRESGTAFSPSRDHAQSLRSSLLNWLSAIESPEAGLALERLSERPELQAVERDWIRHLAKNHTLAEVSKPLAVRDAMTFVNSLILEPRSDCDLFRIACNRLRDIEHHVKHSDFSTRVLYNPDKRIHEKPMQLFLAGELENRARKQYSVVRESEVVDNNEPDIRLWNPRCDGPISIEVKVAERWTVTNLRNAIEKQLVGKYMRAVNSNFGVLALCSSGPVKTWEHDGKNMSFSELVDHLTAHAQELVAKTPSIGGVAVVAVDFH